jgi:hypothetical protein
MAILFEGFPRVLDRTALKPGRWFLASAQRSPIVCFSTEILQDEKPIVFTFRVTKPDVLEFAPCFLEEIPGALTTVEDDLVFSPGDAAAGKLQLASPARRALPSGALLRLRNGDLGLRAQVRPP